MNRYMDGHIQNKIPTASFSKHAYILFDLSSFLRTQSVFHKMSLTRSHGFNDDTSDPFSDALID